MSVPMLQPMVDLLLVAKHWFNYLIGEGVGFRQTTDLAVLINAYSSHIAVVSFKNHLRQIGYLGVMDAIVALVGKYYAVEWPEFWKMKGLLSYKDAYVYADKLLTDVMKNGNFGRADYKYTSGWKKRVETTCRFFHHYIRYY